MADETLDALRKRGIVLAVLRNIESKELVCMCYKNQVDAVAELFLGKNWKDKYKVEDSPPCVILADLQVTLAMAQIMAPEMKGITGRPGAGGGGMGGMFGGGMRPGGGRSMFGGSSSEDDEDDEDEDEDGDESDGDEDEDGADPDDSG